jgi:hypothetical protein
MMNLSLLRTENTSDGVFGLLKAGTYTFVTVEDDWKDNAKGQSCIPAGTYRLRRTVFHKHGYEAFEVTGVPGRTRILIHPANTEEDIEGCIGVGLRRGHLQVRDEDDPAHPLVTKRAVVASQEAFRRFMQEMAHIDEAELLIEWGVGLP